MGNENKVRTFQQSRQLQRAKGASRGFYPIPMLKGKKGKGKGKGKKGKGFHHQASSPSTTSAKPLFSPPGMDRSSTTSGTGCFICGEQGHGCRDCPRQGQHQVGGGKGSKKGTSWVDRPSPTQLVLAHWTWAPLKQLEDWKLWRP